MGQWKYRKPEPATVRGLCVCCNKSLQRKVSGTNKYSSICGGCNKALYGKAKIKPLRIKKVSYKSYKKDSCEKCGFVPEHSCQLDVDHIDCDHSNNSPDNLQTLCANCHRLKTRNERQGS